MAGAGEEGGGLQNGQESDCSFVWDEDSKLYFHASTGFYYNHVAGWYYSSRDGLYYTFENGGYVLLDCNKVSEAEQCATSVCSEAIQDNQCTYCPCAEFPLCLYKNGITGYASDEGTGNQRPPSEWLEETLIDLYLSGYPSSEANIVSSVISSKTEGENGGLLSCEAMPEQLASEDLFSCHEDTVFQQKDGGERMVEGLQDAPESSGRCLVEGALWNEENWQAQYGQVVRSGDEHLGSFPVVELWDWEMIVETAKKRHQVSRLVGRLVRCSSKLHPSMPVGGGLLKTAAIREVHRDLVRVASGKVYRLRSPNKRYLGSLSSYDSSNPTKDWGFPDLFANMQGIESICSSQCCGSDYSHVVNDADSFTTHHQSFSSSGKHDGPAYRDRAAERRSLHGCFSIGPGQKNLLNSKCDEAGSSSDAEEAAAETLNLTFGPGSYSRRILESMGWKEGEALGSSTKGILEPLQAVGNKGYAGLGWDHLSRKF